MQMALFLKNKVLRQLKCNGSSFEFVRKTEDKYHQKNGQETKIEIDLGLFHQSTAYVTIITSEGTRVRSKPQPMILMLNENSSKLKVDDQVMIGSNQYKVLGFTDIQNLGVVSDVSLEMIV